MGSLTPEFSRPTKSSAYSPSSSARELMVFAICEAPLGTVAIVAMVIGAGATSCAADEPPKPPSAVREGLASYYARSLDGKTTASGVPFDNAALVAAHPTYPFGTLSASRTCATTDR